MDGVDDLLNAVASLVEMAKIVVEVADAEQLDAVVEAVNSMTWREGFHSILVGQDYIVDVRVPEGWWVQDLTKEADKEFISFSTEFAARMFAAGMSGLLYKGYGRIRRDRSSAGKNYFEAA